MTTAPFDVLPFSADNLSLALSNDRCTSQDVAVQDRAKYLRGYLSAIGAQTIIVEYEYTDGDYLEDFASYYVRCFATYARRCKRLHFFSTTLSDETIRGFVRGGLPKDDDSRIQESYLGFVVARPLPSAIVGRT